MPAARFTKKANTPKKKRQWDHVYQSVKARGGSAKDAVIRANGVVKRSSRKKSRKSRRSYRR
jgi:hypothetical protein